MQESRLAAVVLMCVVLMTTVTCKHTPEEREHGAEGEVEETGPRLAINETCDAVRKGVRLILAYDSTSSAFIGTVENITHEEAFSVRVEVHLSDGTELGPTSPTQLGPGDKATVNLSAAEESFTWWKAHAETSGPDGEHVEEHGREDGAEHGSEHGVEREGAGH